MALNVLHTLPAKFALSCETVAHRLHTRFLHLSNNVYGKTGCRVEKLQPVAGFQQINWNLVQSSNLRRLR